MAVKHVADTDIRHGRHECAQTQVFHHPSQTEDNGTKEETRQHATGGHRETADDERRGQKRRPPCPCPLTLGNECGPCGGPAAQGGAGGRRKHPQHTHTLHTLCLQMAHLDSTRAATAGRRAPTVSLLACCGNVKTVHKQTHAAEGEGEARLELQRSGTRQGYGSHVGSQAPAHRP